jgi:uncharacterized membrane protein required for colicin V production
VNLGAFIGSLTLTDGVLIVLFVMAFALGFAQGLIRQLLGVGAFVVAFVVSAHLRTPIGAWLAQYWNQLPSEFSVMIAFVGSFVVLMIAMTLAVQAYYQRIPLSARLAVVDEILGAIIAAVVAMLSVSAVVLAMDQYYKGVGLTPPTGDVGWIRSLWQALDGAALVHFMRENVIAALMAVLGGLLPTAVQSGPR